MSWLRARFFRAKTVERIDPADCPFSREVVAARADRKCDLCGHYPSGHRTRAEWNRLAAGQHAETGRTTSDDGGVW